MGTEMQEIIDRLKDTTDTMCRLAEIAQERNTLFLQEFKVLLHCLLNKMDLKLVDVGLGQLQIWVDEIGFIGPAADKESLDVKELNL